MTKNKLLLGSRIRENSIYLFFIPGFIFLIIFHYVPMYGVVIAFKDFSMIKGIAASEWIGFENFGYLFRSKTFYNAFWNSLVFSGLRLVFGFPAPLFLALFLNEVRHSKFKRTIQTVSYIPHFISWVVISGMVINFLSPTAEGLVNYFIRMAGKQPINFLISSKYFRGIIIVEEIWKEAGWGAIIYLAALSGIDVSLYEAATIDGASRIQQIRYITIPGIASTIVVLLILRLGSILNNGFEQIYLLYGPAVYDVADVLETYTFRIGLQEGRFSFATAVGIFKSVVNLILLFTFNKLAKAYSGNQLW